MQGLPVDDKEEYVDTELENEIKEDDIDFGDEEIMIDDSGELLNSDKRKKTVRVHVTNSWWVVGIYLLDEEDLDTSEDEEDVGLDEEEVGLEVTDKEEE